MLLLQQLNDRLTRLWDNSPPGKALARRRAIQLLAGHQQELANAAQQARARIERGRMHLDEPQMAFLNAWLAQIDTERTTLVSLGPDAVQAIAQITQDSLNVQQRYRVLERCVQAAVTVAMGKQNVVTRIGQIQQAIADLPESGSSAEQHEAQALELAQIEAHLQRLQQRHQDLLQQPPAAADASVPQFEKLANDFNALDQRGLKLWRTLPPPRQLA